MAVLFSPLYNGFQGFLNNGNPNAGGLLYTYAAGTSTPQATYTDSTGGTPNANPIVLDSSGRVTTQIWLTQGSAYKFVLQDSLGNPIKTDDQIQGILPQVVNGSALASNSVAASKLAASQTAIVFGRQTAGAGAGEEITCTAAGRSLIAGASAAAQLSTLGAAASGVVTGSGITTNSGTLVGRTTAGSGALEIITVTGSASLGGGILNVAPVRQTVLQASVDSTGLPNYITIGTGLSVNIAATATNIIMTAANGQAGDRIGKITADTTIGSLSANTTNYLLGTIAADGTVTLSFTTLAPVYQWGGTQSVTSNQFTFNIQQMSGAFGNGSSAVQQYSVFLGEAVTNGSNVTSVINYALQGRYEGPFVNTLPSAGTLTTVSHNLGVVPDSYDFDIKCITGDGGYAVGDQFHATGLTANDGTYRLNVPVIATNKTLSIIGAATTPFFQYRKDTFVGFNLTLANWAYRGWAVRGW